MTAEAENPGTVVAEKDRPTKPPEGPSKPGLPRNRMAFIRSLGLDATAEEILHLAEVAGVEGINRDMISRTKYAMRVSAGIQSVPPSPKPKKKMPDPRWTSKADFVRSCPLDMPVPEVILAGARAGFKINPSNVHTARSDMKRRGKNGKPKSVEGVVAEPLPPITALARQHRAEILTGLTAEIEATSQFKRLILTIGLAKAQEIMQAMIKQLDTP